MRTLRAFLVLGLVAGVLALSGCCGSLCDDPCDQPEPCGCAKPCGC